MTDYNPPDGHAPVSVIRDEIRHFKRVSNLLVTYVNRLQSEGEPELLAVVDSLLTHDSQDADSLYSSLYRIGFQQGRRLGYRSDFKAGPLLSTAGGRAAMIGYCRGMSESWALYLEDLELRLSLLESSDRD